MKNVIFILFVTALMACNNTEKPASDNAEQTEVQQPATSNETAESTSATKPALTNAERIVLGTWTGEMNNKKLTIVIEQIDGATLVGYNVLGTNKRNLKGTLTESSWDQPCARAYEAVLNEPGDEKWDGVYSIKFVGFEDIEETETGPNCIGNLKGVEAFGEWKANNGKLHHKQVRLDKN